ncbi:translocation/assembly module TamB domain-containing protein [Cypionkella sp.]|uniref:translocation/assembly module TamB domain-containing protein n=1 Tax=Cypionkella sp. TaxID=2811411 RepID=UPI002618354B|nr:translocation/assembly module TamB domain-containing protein [Cypionkella sp.]MDB5666810.1 translocation and assembly module protein TamB [Cypionkella sp.]
MRKYFLAGCLALLPMTAPLHAQTDDRDYLTAFLEDSLSGAGRKVVVTGFAGALSSKASLTELTIADDSGVWLTLRDVTLDWSRSSLLSGAVVVNELTAGEIVLDRLPETGSDTPAPEAGTFTLPELPVSVEIGEIAAKHIVLGPSVLGTGLEATLQASLSLSDGEGKATLVLERTDAGPAGKVSLNASYINATQQLSIDLAAEEAAGGIASVKLGLPGAPAVALTVKGAGPVSDFAADVALTTDGVNRLAGKIALTGKDDGATAFSADLAGDLAPLFLPSYAEFFGNSVSLTTVGQRWPDGRLALDSLAVKAKALELQGSLALAADGLPQKFNLTGKVAAPDGGPVVLPLTTDLPVKVRSADIALSYDATQDEGWSANIAVLGLDRADFRASSLALSGSGRIARVADARQVGGSFRYTAEGLEPTDRNLGRALGSVIWGDGSAYWREGDGSVTVQKLTLSGEDYSAQLNGMIEGLGDAFAITGKASAKLADLSRLSGLAGRNLGGAAAVEVSGNGSPITGAFDLIGSAIGTDMQAGQPELDNLLRGQAVAKISIKRDTEGTTLRDMTINAATLTAQATGTLATAGSDIVADLNFSDLSVLGGQYRGSLIGRSHLTGTLAVGQATLDATARGLAIGNPQADKLLAGNSTVALALSMKDGVIQVDTATLSNPQLEAKASGAVSGDKQTVDLTARLNNLALIVPEFPGALTVSGTAVQDGSGVTLNLAGKGPGQIDATVTGKLAPGFGSADLAIKGTAQAALANAFLLPRVISGQMGFDLRLNGPLGLESLSGPLTLSGGRLVDPSLGYVLQNIAARANLARGRTVVDVTLDVSTGGSVVVTGSAGLVAPYAGDLAVDVRQVTLRDPDLYETTLNGNVTVQGPLMGGAAIAGRIALSETELRVPSTGFGGAAGLPGLQHANEPKDVHATRARAGLLNADKNASLGGGGPSYGLNLVVSAPSLFIRGRGLDVEMGGELRLLGTTDAVVPSGSFDLIRGRLELLGKRLDLTEAVLQMEGDLVPSIHIVATTPETDGITSGVTIDGPANDPVVTFFSTPELPQEEVLARLLFGQDLQNLSALQALQLANAVATLAGRGGESIVSKLRQGFGLDNLDLKTDASGGTSVTAGKYLTKNIYSEVTVGQDGQTDINLNLDISKSITLRAQSGSDGDTGLGIVLEKDY